MENLVWISHYWLWVYFPSKTDSMSLCYLPIQSDTNKLINLFGHLAPCLLFATTCCCLIQPCFIMANFVLSTFRLSINYRHYDVVTDDSMQYSSNYSLLALIYPLSSIFAPFSLILAFTFPLRWCFPSFHGSTLIFRSSWQGTGGISTWSRTTNYLPQKYSANNLNYICTNPCHLD